MNQTVVNSFDPNDKTCLEGATIPPSAVGKYVHYMIRFENKGTAEAQNVVVKDMIDTENLILSSLVSNPRKSSFCNENYRNQQSRIYFREHQFAI